MVERLELKSKLSPYFDLALKEVRTEARVDSAWKHLLAGDHTELFNEAKALFDEGRLFHSMPKAPLKTAEAADLIPLKFKVCFLDESAEEGADDEMKFSSRRRRSHQSSTRCHRPRHSRTTHASGSNLAISGLATCDRDDNAQGTWIKLQQKKTTEEEKDHSRRPHVLPTTTVR